MKAEDYTVDKSDNYFYMFNPFSVDILHQVMKNIIKSKKEHPRMITLIIYYCTCDIINALREYSSLRLEKIIKLEGYEKDPDEKAYIYKL